MIKTAWDDTKVDTTDDILAADWNSMVTDQKLRGKVNTPEEKRGSDCSGTSPNKGRVLVLANTVLTTLIMVFRNGAWMPRVDITISHLTSGSTITFTNINITDTDYIDVIYFT